MPIDRNSPVVSEQSVYSPWDLNKVPGDTREGPGFVDTMAAGFRLENEVGSYVASEAMDLSKREYYQVTPDYNPFQNGDLEGYEDHVDRFMEAHNPKVVAAIKADIDRETRDRETLDAAGWGGFGASVVASLISPTTLLPGGALVRSGRAGFSLVKSGAVTGLAAAGAAAAQEGALHATQQTRTGEETAFAVGGAFILGGLLGAGGAQLLTKQEYKAFSKAIDEDLADETLSAVDLADSLTTRAQAAGAAAVDKINPEDLAVAGPKAAKAIARATAAVKLNPGMELLHSPSDVVKSTFLKLTENTVKTEGEASGRTLGPAAETVIKQYEARQAQFVKSFSEIYAEARKAGGESLTKAEFSERVAKAARRNDTDPQGNEYVTQAAQVLRKEVLDPAKVEAIRVGLLPEGIQVTTADSYLHRVWNVKKIVAESPQFLEIVRRYVRDGVRDAIGKQEEIGIAKNINRAVDTEEQLSRAMDRLSSVENRLGQRGKAREGKLASIRRQEGQRFDVLRGRVPESVIAAAKAARDDDVMVRQVAEAATAAKPLSAKPMQRFLKEKGGVNIGSKLDQELRAMGITPKTAPGLFRKNGGVRDVDNFVAREDDLLARFQTDQNGYADRDEILAALRDEMGGAPIRTEDELASEAARDILEQNAEEWLSQIGLPSNATVKQVREYLSNALKNEAKLSELDQRIGRMNGELEEFDRATDKIINERTIAEAEAGRYADELNDLEAKINEVRELANASPRVKILVDYADARKAYSKGRYEQSRLENRITAIERVDSEGRLTPDLENELRALRSDKNKADERVIKAKAKVDKLKPMLPKDRGDELDFFDENDLEGYVDEVVKSIYDNITGIGRGDVPDWIVPAKRGPLKERVFNIRDELVEDFLENDAERVSEVYTRKMAPDVEITRSFGSADMAEQIKEINADYDKLIEAATTPEERTKLSKRRDRDVEIVEAFRDQLRHNYRTDEAVSEFGQITRAALAWNYVRLLGGQLISSLADAANVLTKQGLDGFTRDAMPVLTSGLEAAKISRQDARDFVTILETVHNARSASLADLNNPYVTGSPADRLIDNVTTKFSRLTGINWWNSTMKQVVATQTMNRVAKNIMAATVQTSGKSRAGEAFVDYSKLSKWERGFMGGLNISEDVATRARTQILKHGRQDNEIWGLNLGKWDDPEAQRVVIAAIQKEAGATVITPGVADKMLWARSNTGKLIMQFKTHALSSHQRIMMSRLQGRPRALAEYIAMSTTMGMMVAYLKFIEKGDLEGAKRLRDNPGLFISEGIDRAGYIPILMEGSNIMEKWGAPFGIKTAIQAAAGDEDRGGSVGRYATRGPVSAIAGPTMGLFEDLVTIASEASKGDFSKRGVNAMSGLVPGGTLPGVRYGMQQYVKPTLQEAAD